MKIDDRHVGGHDIAKKLNIHYGGRKLNVSQF